MAKKEIIKINRQELAEMTKAIAGNVIKEEMAKRKKKLQEAKANKETPTKKKETIKITRKDIKDLTESIIQEILSKK